MCSHFANLLDGQKITTLPHQDLSPEDPILSYNPRDRLVVIHNGSITTGSMAILEIAKAKYPRLKWLFRRFSSGRLLIVADTAYEFVAKRRTIVDHLFLVKTHFRSKP
jgi:predicted DCC family thiol-disulfide oxidoreductase YuxK